MSTASGPITIVIYEGMVKVAERSYVDVRTARFATRRWPKWMTTEFRRIEAHASRRRFGAEETKEAAGA